VSVFALDGKAIRLVIAREATPAGAFMIAQHTQQYFDAQRLEIGDITGNKGAIDLWIEIQFGLPVGGVIDISGEDNGEAKYLFSRTAVGKTARIVETVGIDFHICGCEGSGQGCPRGAKPDQ